MLRSGFTGSVVVIFALSGGMLFYSAASEHREQTIHVPFAPPLSRGGAKAPVDGRATASDREAIGRRAGIASIEVRPSEITPPSVERPTTTTVLGSSVVTQTAAQPEGLGRHIHPLVSPWRRTVQGIERTRAVLGGIGPVRDVDYSDPSGRDAVPLMLVWGADGIPLSEHFRVGDFAASDGAAYARISRDLVTALERLQSRLRRKVHVTSGYRHPALNHRQSVLGAGESFHMSGLAADIWAENATPIEIAQAALDTLGCGIGLGLGAYFVHVDLRGWPASWSRDGAMMDEVDFDLWMLERCDDDRRSAKQSTPTAPASGLTVAGKFRDEIGVFAEVQRKRGRRGAVILDMRRNIPGRDTSAAYRLDFAEPGSPLLRSLSLEALMEAAEGSGAFVYVIVHADGAQDVGLMDYRNILAHGGRP